MGIECFAEKLSLDHRSEKGLENADDLFKTGRSDVFQTLFIDWRDS